MIPAGHVGFGFSTHRGPNWVSTAIRWWLKTPYSHCFVSYQDEKGRHMVFQATGPGISSVEMRDFLEDNMVNHTFVVPLTSSHERLLGYIDGSEGKSYSKLQLFGIVLASVLGLKRSPFDNGFSEGICSETAAWIAEKHCGVEVAGDIDLVTPKSFYELLAARK